MEEQAAQAEGIDGLTIPARFGNVRLDDVAESIVRELEAKGVGPRGVWPDHRLAEWSLAGNVTYKGKTYFPKINSASIDLAVSPYFARPKWYWRNRTLSRLLWRCLPAYRRDMKDKRNTYFYWEMPRYYESIILDPGECVLMSSVEAVKIPDDAGALLRAKSTSGRMMLEFCDAGWGDPGFGCRDKDGNPINGSTWTFEAFNPAPWPILVKARDYYIQMIMFDLSSAAKNPYGGRYAVQGEMPLGPREEVYA